MKVSAVYQYKATGKFACKRNEKQIFQADRLSLCFANLLDLLSRRWVASSTEIKTNAVRLLL